MKTSIRTALTAVLLLVTATVAAASLIGAAANVHNWGELTTPALLVASLMAYAIGNLVFTPRRRRR